MAQCKYCKAKIEWLSHRGKMIPVNANTIDISEQASLKLNMVVPFNPVDHTRHTLTCPHFIKQQQMRMECQSS